MERAGSSTFEDLYKAHAKEVVRLLWALGVKDAEERRDLAQEVWLTVARHVGRFEHRSPRVWLGVIARNAVKTWRRTRRRRPELGTRVPEGVEAVEVRTPASGAEEERWGEALRAFVEAAIPDEERREAYLLHEVMGQTAREVAETTGVSVEKAQGRLQMARRDIERASRGLSDAERDRLRKLLPPFASADELMKALGEELRAGVSDEEVEEVHRRVLEQLAREGFVPDEGEGAAPAGQAAGGADSGYTLFGGKISAKMAGVFLAGALAGGGGVYAAFTWGAWQSRPAEVPAPARGGVVAPESRLLPDGPTGPGPTGSSSAAPAEGASRRAPADGGPVTRRDKGPVERGSPEEAEVLLGRARHALTFDPRRALGLLDSHARLYPDRDAAKREEVAVRALVLLGDRSAAEARATALVRSAPWMRGPMEDLFGRRFP